jgi:hypothetical protein
MGYGSRWPVLVGGAAFKQQRGQRQKRGYKNELPSRLPGLAGPLEHQISNKKRRLSHLCHITVFLRKLQNFD